MFSVGTSLLEGGGVVADCARVSAVFSDDDDTNTVDDPKDSMVVASTL
jgi:hypothetical protein